jgi:dTMP kinase
MQITLADREKELVELLKAKTLSSSHHLDHLQQVAYLASELAKIHQADREIVVAASLLHDLGRSDTNTRGPETAQTAATEALELLKVAGYSTEEITKITQAIREHDDPKFHSTLLESRVLKDADYLDGFGARGILRSLVYAGETKGGVPEAIDRIRRKMRDRLDGLEFIESRRLAWKQWRLVEVFLAELEAETHLAQVAYPGKFIVLEGISGSGKDTQAKLLAEHLERQRQPALAINHPTSLLKEVWQIWKPQVKNEVSDVFLLLADRFRMVREQITPALQAGKVVISSRSSLSSQAYQPSPEVDPAFYRFWFSFEPMPDALIYFKLDPHQAAGRTQERVTQGQEPTTGFFDKTQVAQAERYRQLLPTYPNVIEVDASREPDQVFDQVVQALSEKGVI